jgi:large subunit ribosomal protein L28
MARRCSVTGKGVMAGNNVSHANNKTRRRFLPNLQVSSLYSESLGQSFRMRVTTAALRTIEHKGGLDSFVRETPAIELPRQLRSLKKQLAAAATAA